MSALLDIADLHFAIGDTPVLRGVSLQVGSGCIVGLVGESGAGKSMVGRVILGLEPDGGHVTGGGVSYDGKDLVALGGRERHALLGREIALVPQNPMTALNPVARIEPQITDVLRQHLGLDASAARTRALELLESVHIREPERVLRQFPHELSGGMRQRILIAIAFACRPRLVVADEPTTALDVTVQRQILRLLKELQAAHGTAVLFITHDLGVVAKICDEVAVMHSGRILESGTTADLFRNPVHAYTRALFAATPRHDRPDAVPAPIPDALSQQLIAEAQAVDASRHSKMISEFSR